MKRSLFVFLGLSLLFVTACSNPFNGGKEKYTTYEYHYYDTLFEHTEETIAKYDKNGDLVEYEETMLYDKVTDKNACNDYRYSLEGEKGATESCKTTDEGTRITYTVTKEYFDNHKEDMENTDDEYKKLFKEETAKEMFNDLLEKLKEEVTHSDKYNYVVIADKKIEW